MNRNTSIVLDEHFSEFVEQQVEDGHYASPSEVVSAGLRLLEDENEAKKLEALRAALEEGERSGFDPDFDFETFLQEKRHTRGA